MLDIICRLYKEGKIKPDGLLEKTADVIARNELDKFAGILSRFTGSGYPMSKELIKSIIKSSPDPKTMLDTLAKLKSLTPEEQKLVAKHSLGVGAGLLSKIKARISGSPMLAKGLGGGGAVATLGLGSHLLEKAEAKKRETTEEAALQNILKRNPDFDKKKSKELFSVLQSIAPTLASSPVAAEGFIQPHLQWPTLPYTAIKDLAQIEKHVADTQGRDQGLFANAFSEIGEALASLLSLGS